MAFTILSIRNSIYFTVPRPREPLSLTSICGLKSSRCRCHVWSATAMTKAIFEKLDRCSPLTQQIARTSAARRRTRQLLQRLRLLPVRLKRWEVHQKAAPFVICRQSTIILDEISPKCENRINDDRSAKISARLGQSAAFRDT